MQPGGGNIFGSDYPKVSIDAPNRWLESIDISVEHFIDKHTEDISDDEEMLHYYGFELVDDTTEITINSPIDIVPMIPVYYGKHYHRYIRGGFFMEQHGPIHIWRPFFNTSGGVGGYVVAGKQVGARGTDFLLAKISIPLGKTLVMAPDAWHNDGTLAGGVYITSFSFGKGGPREAKAATAAVGFVISHLSRP
jgi:hypothetical protein